MIKAKEYQEQAEKEILRLRKNRRTPYEAPEKTHYGRFYKERKYKIELYKKACKRQALG